MSARKGNEIFRTDKRKSYITYKTFKRKAPLKLINNIYLHRCYAEKTKNKTSTKAIYETVFQ